MHIDAKYLPRKIILSRKGFDSIYGGKPSPIANGELLSLPIPEHLGNNDICPFQDHPHGSHLKFNQLGVTALTNHFGNNVDRCVHLDPDIRPSLRPKGASREGFFFGQSGAAQAHLTNNEVGLNDLFLFFGWFEEEDLRLVESFPTGKHVIWGWFQIDEPPYTIDSAETARNVPLDARHHPHVTHWQDPAGTPKRRNTLYTARKRLRFAESLNAAGVFRNSDAVTLTRLGETRSKWRLPKFVQSTGMTYHQGRLGNEIVKGKFVNIDSAQIGQEFVIPLEAADLQTREEVASWLSDLFKSAQLSS